ncbi:MAG: glutamine synthetase [Myxococcales bacterium FL481]|nr:MAG: glutamine synthetase [Myxococcales bacterium FL481]
MSIKAEYIWVDGTEPTSKLRSKTKILALGEEPPVWGFDGSSTGQARGGASDCVLQPVFTCPDPIRGDGSLLVLCEVYGADGQPHVTNQRAALRAVAERHAAQEPLYGMEQEYTMFEGRDPLGWPKGGYPAPQGPFYCGVGADEAFGRQIVERHMDHCLEAGLKLSGVNAEVMPGQWEFQIGPVGPLEVSDHIQVARWLLYRTAEDFGVSISLHPKPVKGDWNGAGCHTNFSTRAMRSDGGIDVITAACEKLGERVDAHLAGYGHGIEQRLTGAHETCSYKEFRYGVGDRGASIRIPLAVDRAGKGYLEDRRPCSNIDPYVVARLLLETCCE